MLTARCRSDWQQLQSLLGMTAALQLSREQTWLDSQRIARQCSQLEQCIQQQ